MYKIARKTLPGIMVILAMLLGAWVSPVNVKNAASGEQGEKHPNLPDKVQASNMVMEMGSLNISSYVEESAKGSQQRAEEINSYSVDFSKVSSQSEFDKQFVEESLTSNSLELWMLEYSYPRVKDPVLKDVIGAMIPMHVHDQDTLVKLAGIVGVSTTVDFTNASVYPQTPDWDLGKRTENLKEDYLDPLVEPAKVSFDDRAQSELESAHTSDVQSELTAEREVVNPELKAFAKHSADVTELHLQWLDASQAHLNGYDEPPTNNDNQSSYMDPHMYFVGGNSTCSSGNSSCSGSSK